MDLIDLFIGAEGTLGIITAAELRVVPAPETNCAVVTFWPSETVALEFTRQVRQRKEPLGIEAIEYFGPDALRLLRRRRTMLGAASGVPECLPAEAGCAIYLDIGTAAAELPNTLEALAGCVRAGGGNPNECWTGMAKAERDRLRVFRHALPETVNSIIAEIRQTHPQVTKLGTDMAVPDECLERILHLYRERLDAKGLDYVVFGHIGDNHLHVNILPRNPDEYAAGKELYLTFARDVVAMGGSPAAEHGIGKLKTGFLKIMYGEDGVAQMLAVKRVFDPDLRLGKGTLFA
jgi:D-lactate dehydrogenase (cytochrome)